MGKGSEVSIPDKIKDGKSLYSCKVPPTLEEAEKLTDESSLESENYGSESKNDCGTEM